MWVCDSLYWFVMWVCDSLYWFVMWVCDSLYCVDTAHKKSTGIFRRPKQRWSVKQNLNPQQRKQATKRWVVIFVHECKTFQYPNTNSLWWLKLLLISSLREFLLQLSGSVMNFHCLIIMQISLKCVTKCWLCRACGGSTHQ